MHGEFLDWQSSMASERSFHNGILWQASRSLMFRQKFVHFFLNQRKTNRFPVGNWEWNADIPDSPPLAALMGQAPLAALMGQADRRG